MTRKKPHYIASEIVEGKATAREIGHALYYYASTIHEEGIDIQAREMWIAGEWTNPHDSSEIGEPGVEYNMATRAIKNLHILRRASATEPVTIHLHTCGGFVEEGLAIYDAIKMMPYKVKMISYTHARSMSSYILQAADERLLLPHSYFLFHDGEMYIGGTQKQVFSGVDFARVQDEMLTEIYVDAMKRNPDAKFAKKRRQWIKDMLREKMDTKEDVYLTAQDAVAWGFADGILEKF